jgi:hypothetical protein
MNLEKRWDWDRIKLNSRVRIETGNPGADELRERICQLLGVQDFAAFQRHYLVNHLAMSQQHYLMAKETAIDKTIVEEKKASSNNERELPPTRVSTATVQAALRRINTSLNLFNQSEAVRPVPKEEEKRGGGISVAPDKGKHGMPANRRNLYKKFIEVPRSPPRRALFDLKMQRYQMEVKSVAKSGGDSEPHAEAMEEEGEDSTLGSTADATDDGKKRRPKIKPKPMPEPELPPVIAELPQALRFQEPRNLFKPYNGDIFGTETKNEGGMIYLSRMAPRKGAKSKRNAEDSVNDFVEGGEAVEGGTVEAALEEKVTVAPSQKEIQAKIHCAMTLCNWTNYEANTERLAKEGAVQAIVRLSKETDRTIRKYCAAAFRQMSTRPLLVRQLVALGAVPLISDLISNAPKVKQITIDCTIALVNLSKNVGTESKLVEDGIVPALSALANDTEEWDELCARGLFNLTCVDTHYPSMERVIRAFMSLASSSFTSVKYICASALCNIADLSHMRMRMVEEGVISVSQHPSANSHMPSRPHS